MQPKFTPIDKLEIQCRTPITPLTVTVFFVLKMQLLHFVNISKLLNSLVFEHLFWKPEQGYSSMMYTLPTAMVCFKMS